MEYNPAHGCTPCRTTFHTAYHHAQLHVIIYMVPNSTQHIYHQVTVRLKLQSLVEAGRGLPRSTPTLPLPSLRIEQIAAIVYNLQKRAFCRYMHHLDLVMYAFRTYLSQMQTRLNRPCRDIKPRK